jgi:hypothetical protein
MAGYFRCTGGGKSMVGNIKCHQHLSSRYSWQSQHFSGECKFPFTDYYSLFLRTARQEEGFGPLIISPEYCLNIFSFPKNIHAVSTNAKKIGNKFYSWRHRMQRMRLALTVATYYSFNLTRVGVTCLQGAALSWQTHNRLSGQEFFLPYPKANVHFCIQICVA